MEKEVLAEVRKAYSPQHLLAQLGALQENQRKQVDRCGRNVAEVDEKLAAMGPRRERVDADYVDGVIDGTAYSRIVERLEAEGEALRQQREAAVRELRMVEHLPVDQERIALLAAQIDGLAELKPDQMRELLRHLFANLAAYRVKKRGRWNPEPVELVMEHNVKVLAHV